MVLLSSLVLASAVAAAPAPGFELSACQTPGLPPEARCGRYEVFENRAARAGRRIGLNLWGGSYGTRAALVFLRRHPDRVRTATLLGVTPPDDPIPLRFAQDLERALEGVLGECAADAACHAAFPDPRGELRALVGRLGKGPAPVEILNPATGDPVTVSLSRDLAAEALRYLMYGSGSAALVPAVIHQAASGDLAPLAEFALFGRREIVDALGTGLYLSVTCSEDLPFIAPGEGERAAQGSLLGDYRLAQQRRACGLWPRAQVPARDRQSVASQAPVLLMAGQWDPATPPALAEAAAKHLPKARPLVIPQGGHSYEGLQGTDCLRRLVTDFVDRASVEGLDTACLAQVKRPPFATTLPLLKPIALPTADVAKLAGPYRAEGAPFDLTLEAVGNRLRLHLPGNREYLLVPVAADRFRLPGALGLYLVFGFEDGRVTRAILEESGEATLVLKPH